MENHIMKKHKTSLTGFVLGLMVLLVGIQGALAQNTNPITCKGTVYFKAPDSWTAAYIGGFNVNTLRRMTLNSDGYYEYNLANLGITDNQHVYFAIGNQQTASATLEIVTNTRFAFTPTNTNDNNWPTNQASLACPGDGKVVYVAENPSIAGRTYMGEYTPDAKYFYMLVPDEKVWQSDDLVMTYTAPNGTKKDTVLSPSHSMCGWVEMVFNYAAPEDAIIYLKNDPTSQLGLNGLWDDDDTPEVIDLSLVFDAYQVNKLYFIPDDAAWPAGEDSKGWYTVDPQIEGTCSFSLAAVIYDTDMQLNSAFSDCCGPDKGKAPAGVEACTGVLHNLVLPDLGPDDKPQLNTSNATALACFGGGTVAQTNFNALFNYVPGMNEVQCYDMPFRHYGTDTRWGFDSDSATSGTGADQVLGGFYPLENSSDASVVTLNGVLAGPTPLARTPRPAAGPVPNNSKEVFGVDLDYVCETPGFEPAANVKRLIPTCQGLFSDGSEFTSPDLWCWGSYCADAVGTPGFQRWGYESGDNYKTTVKRNQHFCFQSHATFTYNESQEFTFRGDDDIWVFINKKIAVDNGGAHLAAPGHVVLKNLNKTYGANFLEPGKDYPIDIFFCDRRTTMSNVIIKTNMYIKQSTGIDFTTEEVGSGGLLMDICVEKTGGGDCAAVALGGGGGQTTTRECGDNITANIGYSVTTRKGDNPANCADCANLTLGTIVHNGIDLTNPKKPIVYPEKITGLAPGTYRLWFEVDGKNAYYQFRIKGNLGIVANDVTFSDVDEAGAAYPSGTTWKFVDKALAGTRIPIYVSAPDDMGGIDIISPPGQSYTLMLTAGANLYKNKDDETPLAVPFAGQVNPTGIDTFWVDVPLAGLTGPSQQIVASVGNTSATLTFYAPQLAFATPGQKDADGNVISWNPIANDPDVDEDGSEYFHWVNADVDFYLIVMDPSTNSLCKECNFVVDALGRSNGLEVQVSAFNEGVALVRVRSSVEYSVEAADMVVGSTDNDKISAPYGNMHFYKPPAPMPLIVDVFDVKGEPIGEMNIPSDFHTESADYLDGKADSVAVIYDRAIHPDSVPRFICLKFDESQYEKINPYKLGLSNNNRDTEMECSTQFDSAAVAKAYAKSPDNGRTIVFSVDTPLSKEVKTLVNPENKIYSFTEYQWKGKPVRTFFEKGLTDRMAPIILEARAKNEKDGGLYDLVTIRISEPVNFISSTGATQAFTYYLNSAIDFQEERQRLFNSVSMNGPASGKDVFSLRYYNAESSSPTPHVGDYIRFRADEVMWTDTSNGVAAGSDTLRMASDADMHWNSPTNYNSTTRLPSPWVQVVGDAKIDVTTIRYNYADPANVNESTPIGEVFPVKTSENLEDIKAKYPTTLGHFVQTDMGSIIGSDTNYTSIPKGDVVFHYEVDYFTNLGTFVGHQSGKIACDDPFFSADPNGAAHSGDCVKNPRNFYVAWNMVAYNHRLVGTGAYITKYTSFVKLGNMGKKAKKEKTEVWGVKRGSGKVR